MLQASLFSKGMPKYTREFERLTGISIKLIEYGYTDIPAKILAEAVAKTGQYDIFNDTGYIVPDGVGAGVLEPLDKWMEVGKPDFGGIPKALRLAQTFRGKTYFVLMDGDHAILAMRKDLMGLPKARAAFKAKFGWEPRCPNTWKEWDQLASFYQGKKGQDFYGVKLTRDLYGAQEYRARKFAYRWWLGRYHSKGKLLFDDNMKPLIDAPEGVETTPQFLQITKYMHPDSLGWATPQNYPFFAQGNSFSIHTFPSIVAYAEKNPKTVIKGKVKSCLVPGTAQDGKLIRRSIQGAGFGYMVNHYSKHPEAAYWFIQWLSGPDKGNEVVADPAGFWDPFRANQITDRRVIDNYGEEFVKITWDNARVAIPMLMLRGNAEYHDALDKNLHAALQGQITAKEAMQRTAQEWERITDDIGRQDQIRDWRAQVKSGYYTP